MMVRLFAFLCVFLALAGVALAGIELQRVLSGAPLHAADPATNPQTSPSQPAERSARSPRRWPALFGVQQVSQPQPPTPPTPPAQPQPPVSSLGYVLKGTVTQGGSTWAILAHPAGDRIVKAGDFLTDGVKVVEIDGKGLWVDNGRGREVLEFAE